MSDAAFQQCIAPTCAQRYEIGEVLYACRHCGSLLDIAYEWDRVPLPASITEMSARRETTGSTFEAAANLSGVWRFRELLPPARLDELATVGEGRTLLQQADDLAAHLGHKTRHLFLQYEGFNPSGSFKDNGMAAAFTIARRLGRRRVACASTGNTSASLALFARHTHLDGTPMQALVFVGGDRIAFGKLAQALDYGARTIQVRGDFDACMKLVQDAADRIGLYVMNSVNPFRLEGQKTIMYRVLEGLGGDVPDWIVVPGGNLGNSSAFGKAFVELKTLGLIDRLPRLAIVNAAGANALHELYNEHGVRYNKGALPEALIDAYFAQRTAEGRHARTVASAIEIGQPVNLLKALRSLEALDGIVCQVTDAEILDGKALVGKFGFGCEPASGASVAGLKQLLARKIINPDERVVCILTGHGLKDAEATVRYHRGSSDTTPAGTFANPPVAVDADLEAIVHLMEQEQASRD